MVLYFISNKLLTNGSHIGYHILHQHLSASMAFVDRKTVRVALKSLNPEGAGIRQANQFQKRNYRVECSNQL